jgi:hypothetical protein
MSAVGRASIGHFSEAAKQEKTKTIPVVGYMNLAVYKGSVLKQGAG